jgi:4-diphosphocytidyl-2C-methyl-D-erythritol kinase
MGLGVTEYLAEPGDLNSWPALPARALLARLVNDLEQPAFDLRPELGQLRSEIEQLIDRPVRMSGSGSTLFSLFDTEAEANEACQKSRDRFAVKTMAVELAPS